MGLAVRRRLGLAADAPDQRAEAIPPGLAPGDRTTAIDPVSAEVEFAAYAEDCRIFGFWRHDAERMSDALNSADAFLLHDVLVVSLADGHTVEAREFRVPRNDILAVRGTGPRGNVARRSRTRPSPVTLQTGPYTIHGYLHGPPGADAVRQIRRRPTMVPLTEAWIEYATAGAAHRARVGPIIVNRESLDWIRHSRDEEISAPGLPVESRIDPHAKDLTGYIRASED